ncbi:MAG: hypothetical protein NTV86_14925 [Planctomycetota bacterium]|nr:hypothetical protein [Planctomycetota bacterium]
MTTRLSWLLAMALTAATALAADTPATRPAAAPAGEAADVSVAVLDYEVTVPGNTDLGPQIAEILATRMGGEPGLVFVERKNLEKVLAEQKLKLVGLVEADSAAQVGRLTGAQLLIMGKAFVMDKQVVIVTKVVGVETGRVIGRYQTLDVTKPLLPAILAEADEIATRIRTGATKLLPPKMQLQDPLPALKEKLKGLALPIVAVIIPESHVSRAPRTPDPAVETEIKKMLAGAGFTVLDTGQNALADWARGMVKAKDSPWPSALDKVDYVIVGEAFSEFAVRTGDLVTCAARGEINVIERKTGRIVLPDRADARAVDLAEALAGKTALQNVGRILGLRVLNEFVTILSPPASPGAKPVGEGK